MFLCIDCVHSRNTCNQFLIHHCKSLLNLRKINSMETQVQSMIAAKFRIMTKNSTVYLSILASYLADHVASSQNVLHGTWSRKTQYSDQSWPVSPARKRKIIIIKKCWSIYNPKDWWVDLKDGCVNCLFVTFSSLLFVLFVCFCSAFCFNMAAYFISKCTQIHMRQK